MRKEKQGFQGLPSKELCLVFGMPSFASVTTTGHGPNMQKKYRARQWLAVYRVHACLMLVGALLSSRYRPVLLLYYLSSAYACDGIPHDRQEK